MRQRFLRLDQAQGLAGGSAPRRASANVQGASPHLGRTSAPLAEGRGPAAAASASLRSQLAEDAQAASPGRTRWRPRPRSRGHSQRLAERLLAGVPARRPRADEENLTQYRAGTARTLVLTITRRTARIVLANGLIINFDAHLCEIPAATETTRQ